MCQLYNIEIIRYHLASMICYTSAFGLLFSKINHSNRSRKKKFLTPPQNFTFYVSKGVESESAIKIFCPSAVRNFCPGHFRGKELSLIVKVFTKNQAEDLDEE